MKDSFAREITYARLSLTDLCNLRCRYCMPSSGVEKRAHGVLSFEQVLEITAALKRVGVDKIRLTGGEPLVKSCICDFVAMVKAQGFKTVAMTTNAQTLAQHAHQLKVAGLDAINVSIDSLNTDFYSCITRGGKLNLALQGIAIARAEGFPLKLNAVYLGKEQDVSALIDFAADIGADMRFIEMMPFGGCDDFYRDKHVPIDGLIKDFGLSRVAGLDTHNAKAYQTADGRAVWLIAAETQKFCARCNRIRITSDGRLLPCLHNDLSFDLKPFLGNAEEMDKAVAFAVSQKPEGHHLSDGEHQSNDMNGIGG